MPKMTPPEDATALWRWMDERRVTLEELARLVGYTPQHLSDIRRGVRRPSDELKQKIEAATQGIEKKMGVPRPKGVRIAEWYAKPGATA